jgi:glucose/arabinose dehydrogenase
MLLQRVLSWLSGRRSAARRPSPRRPVIEPLETRDQPAVAVAPGFVNQTFVAGLSRPSSMEFAPDGRLFVVEQHGTIVVVDHGVVQPTPFLTLPINDKLAPLDGIAFDPHFAQNGYLYVYYTLGTGRHLFSRLSRFTADPSNPNAALPGSEVVLIPDIPSPSGFHEGGGMHFGSDGMLYLATGDGLNGGARSQSLRSLDGKVLRLNVDNYPNIVPPDNPFVNRRGAQPLIYALGFRNPFTSAIDPVTGRLYVNDVGQDTFEEVDRVRAGKNYGWPITEGPAGRAGFVDPICAYRHFFQKGNDSAAITGGVFYRGNAFPASYQGVYFFSDYVKGFIRMLRPGHPHRALPFARGLASPVDLDVGPDGYLYYANIAAGTIDVIRPAS